MTSPTAADYPRSTNWSDFERLCRALLSEVYGRQFQRWGRYGQRQNGVDAWITLENGNAIVLQCKGRSQNLGRKLSTVDLDAAIEAVASFPNPIEEIIVLTTALDDKNLHEYASHLTALRVTEGLSRVSVWGWNTICDHIGNYEKIQRVFFGHWFHRLTLKQWLILISVSLLLGGLIALGILSFHESRVYENKNRREVVGELQHFTARLDDLSTAYRGCEKAMSNAVFLFSAPLREVCITPIGERISALEKQVDELTPYLDKDAWREISSQTKLILEDHRQGLLTVEMTDFFEQAIVRSMKGLCPPSKVRDLLERGMNEAHESAKDAMAAQLYYYFSLRDFILPELAAMRARTLVQARQLQGEQLPTELVEQANVLAALLEQRQAFKFQAPDQPFTLSVVKNRASRNIKIQGTDSLAEQARWNEVFSSALTKVFYGRPKDIETLISCGVFKAEARSLAEGE